jgi:hypothetical protein
MEEDRPPVVYLPSLGHGAHLLAWLLRDDGQWWAHLAVTSLVPNSGFGRQDTFYDWELTAHSSLIVQRAGWDYTRVPKRRA